MIPRGEKLYRGVCVLALGTWKNSHKYKDLGVLKNKSQASHYILRYYIFTIKLIQQHYCVFEKEVSSLDQ